MWNKVIFPSIGENMTEDLQEPNSVISPKSNGLLFANSVFMEIL